MKPLKKHPAVLFLLSAAATGAVEYAIGWAGIRFFGLRLWDYRGLFLNIGGIICLRSVLSFAVLALVFHYVIEPAAYGVFGKIDRRIVIAAALVLAALFISDCVLSALFRTPITY